MTARRWSARAPVATGVVAIMALVAGFGGWSATARIDGAIVAPGTVQVQSRRQVVQHPDGGTVAALDVREGDRVRAGEVLLRLDDTRQRAERAILAGQLDEVLARMARLAAERDGASAIRFPDALMARAATDQRLAELMAGQRRLLAARRETLRQQREQLEERATQFANQIDGLRAQRAAVTAQIAIATRELADLQRLLDRGLTQSARVGALRREAAALQGRAGELDAAIAQARGRIAEARLERLRLETARREDAIAALRDLGVRADELRQRLIALDDTLARLVLRAPVDGAVLGLAVHARGAVVRPGEPILRIVPEADRLVVHVRVPTVHVDQVREGQRARLTLPAFDMRRTPSIEGTVTLVSADALADPATGTAYYRAEVTPDADALAALDHVTLVPGMPVEAFLKTGARTPLAYLLNPFSDYFDRAFRED